MSAASLVPVVLGSTVVGGVVGAFVQAGREREEKFRDRMIEASVAFLERVSDAQRAVVRARAAMRDGRGDEPADAIQQATDALWPSVPLLMVVFPSGDVAATARALIQQIEQTSTVLAASASGQPLAEQRVEEHFAKLDRLHAECASVISASIRRPAYRRRMRF